MLAFSRTLETNFFHYIILATPLLIWPSYCCVRMKEFSSDLADFDREPEQFLLLSYHLVAGHFKFTMSYIQNFCPAEM
jgi:hypothetical protein